MAALLFEGTHRQGRPAQQGVDIVAVARRDHRADRGRDEQLLAIGEERLLKRVQGPAGEPLEVAIGAQVRQ